MKQETAEPILSAVFVDYDNVFLSLERKSEEAARRFAKHSQLWVDGIASGAHITPTKSFYHRVERRLVMNRCYGNTVPRRNTASNETDMHSFAFVRHHFLRSGFEIVDCPPLNGQERNSSDIRMVMDIRDYLDHKTNFDEFIILSGDADFTPVLHRLRSHAKRTVIFTSDNTAAHYRALSDGEVREDDLIACLLGEQLGVDNRIALPHREDLLAQRNQIIDLSVQSILEAELPVALDILEERTIRVLGYDNTVGTNWLGAGNFRDLLISGLPETIKLTEGEPYLAFEASRTAPAKPLPPFSSGAEPASLAHTLGQAAQPATSALAGAANEASHLSAKSQTAPRPATLHSGSRKMQKLQEAPAHTGAGEQKYEGTVAPQDLQETISRIHAACEAPPFSPPEYRAIFSLLEQEIAENQFQAFKTLQNVAGRAADIGITMSADDARYILDAVTQGDPWLEQGSSANLFAKRFRNYVTKRCQVHGLALAADELDLIEAWFAGTPSAESNNTQDSSVTHSTSREPQTAPYEQKAEMNHTAQHAATHEVGLLSGGARMPAQSSHKVQNEGTQWWQDRTKSDPGYGLRQPQDAQAAAQHAFASRNAGETATLAAQSREEEDFPRIVRNRLRG